MATWCNSLSQRALADMSRQGRHDALEHPQIHIHIVVISEAVLLRALAVSASAPVAAAGLLRVPHARTTQQHRKQGRLLDEQSAPGG